MAQSQFVTDDCVPLCSLFERRPTSCSRSGEFGVSLEKCLQCNCEMHVGSDVQHTELYEEALRYFAGYIAWRHLKKYPNLGTRTANVGIA
jgi:hypothetical protein